jgi:hypothetical protein
MLNIKKMLAAAVLPLAFAGIAHANDTLPALPTPAIAQSADAYTIENVGKALADLGFDVETLTNDKGVKYYAVKIERNGWTFNVNVSLSNNGEYVWMTAFLGKAPEGTTVPADVFTKMLNINHTYGLTFFSYRAETGGFYLRTAMANRGLSNKVISTNLDQFLSDIQNTQ